MIETHTWKMDNKQEYTDLALFRHQVAGHLPMFWDNGTVCKPAFPVEIDFYTSCPERLPQILPYIPKFIDVVEIPYSPDREIEIQDEKESTYSNWASSLLHKHWDKVVKLGHRYIVLEDLTVGMKKPCIMDIKLGTRQHGLHDSPQKIKSKQSKVNSTTSKTLGLRLCGLQSYRPWQGTFEFHDKHFGRSLDDEGFKNVIHSHFFNGQHLRKDCIKTIIAKLKGLQRVLVDNSSFLFYATSLLLIYEGYVSDSSFQGESSTDLSLHPLADIRMIDFAHTYPSSGQDTDSGTLKGIESLLGILEELLLL